jgi:hypothetical protein
MSAKFLQSPLVLSSAFETNPASLLISRLLRFPPAAAAAHLAVPGPLPSMWGSTDGGTPEVTLETSMGAVTVEVPPLSPLGCIPSLSTSPFALGPSLLLHD